MIFCCIILCLIKETSGYWLVVICIAHDYNIWSCFPLSGFSGLCHYDDVIMTRMASQITSLAIVYSTVYSGADQSKHQSSASLAFVWEIHRGPVNFPHKWPVTRKMFPFDDVIMVHSAWKHTHPLGFPDGFHSQVPCQLTYLPTHQFT